ncbi:hypothetical protein ABT150_23525 [Streptomyces mirabilis]|uniref:hypothetical protein n=1 Tax=Streptomyces mirabilis TaxID=68239 RepID=UPI003318F0B8
MSWRRLRVLIQHLPPESATWTELRNAMSDEELAEQADQGEPERGRWSQSEQLLAVVADRVADLAYLYASANTESKAKKPKQPEPIRRPGAKQVKPKREISEAQADTLFRLINGGAA